MEIESTCLCCDEAWALDASGLCGHCYWSTKAEVQEGLYELRSYLARWAQFTEWCVRNGRV